MVTSLINFQACDWGALDRMSAILSLSSRHGNHFSPSENLAIQRVQHLAPFVTTALKFGALDPTSRSEPLKVRTDCKEWIMIVIVHTQNLDTDEVIPGPPANIIFHLSEAKGSMSAEECLASLRSNWDDRHNRFKLTEEEFLTAFNRYLHDLADARVQQVQSWLEQNTSRFAQHADVQALFRKFQDLAKELKGGVALCGAACRSCSLLCLSGRQHDGTHDCHTNHKCPHACDFVDQHSGMPAPACDMPYVRCYIPDSSTYN